MSQFSNAVTADVICETIPPRRRNADLPQATFAAVPAPPPDASATWRQARISRLIQEILACEPADTGQTSIAVQQVGLHVLANRPSRQTPAPRPGAAFASPRINPMNGEPAAAPSLTRLTPPNAAALRSTTLARTGRSDPRSVPAARSGPPPPPLGWFASQACPATPAAAG